MANDIVAGLFGLSPREVQQQQQNQLNAYSQTVASYAPKGFELASLLGGQAGAGIANIGAGMMGWKNTEVEAAKQREAALGQIDFNTPEGILVAAKAAGDRGDTRMSLQLQMLARQRAAEQQKLASEQQEAEQVGMVRSTEMAKNLAQAQKAMREEEAAKQPTSVAEYQYAVTNGYKGTFQEWLKDKAQSTHISVGGGESKQPIAYVNDKGQVVWGTIGEARGKPAGMYSPEVKGAIAGATEKGKEEAKRAINMAGIGDIVQEAEDLLTGATGKPLPTGSGIGTATDITAGFFGLSPEGAEEAQRLKAIGGALTSKMPRMEGPQSDKDTQLYKEMAGVVGDSTIPRARRIAALNTVKTIWGKYADKNIPKATSGLSVEERLKKYSK